MTVLLMILDNDELRYAVHPLSILQEYSYRKWDGAIVGKDDTCDLYVEEEIIDIFGRLGLEPDRPKRKQDLRKYLYRNPPFKCINLIIKIGWVQ